MSSNKQNRIPQDELAMRSILKDMGITGNWLINFVKYAV